ncbi:MetQ/NlpA family ABC transporter substrate-binding protein [Alkalicoccobacillus plakortidis]|uniref:Lipoprotein n=1 Tax=Alkalicoccobacillus plakortidis TaxID=444060 RepID=A0ABT0XIP8_9BACI|nr:MetQ/NlpA family ABC transporter substrate-binding protein [Alkalicoccobacillus plakortidis]MCM2675781.1 MetQ/NlpA family ABC transporter substrate-binding protein [Alkalicoccobacillus plakortidis]
MKRLVVVGIAFGIFLGGCSVSSGQNDETVKVGIRNSEEKTWTYIQEKAEEEGVDLELVELDATVDPNQILVEGDIDINAFQHIAYLDLFNEANETNIVPIATTIIAPLGMYSDTITEISELADGSTVALPNDSSNWGRALALLQSEGLIKLVDDFDGNGGADKVKENPKNLEFVPVDGASAPRVMEDLDAAIINNGVALQANLMLDDAVIHEDATAKPYINIIATLEENKDQPAFQTIIDIYQSDETANFIEETYDGNYLPTFITLEELSTYKETY